MNEEPSKDLIGRGRFLQLVRRGDWEYVERTNTIGAVFIAAVTDLGRMLVTTEHRIPVGADVIGCPAGLIGDAADLEGESFEAAVRRELIEEAGYEAESIELLTRGPTSPGMSNEVIAIVLATGLRRVGAGGGIGNESIVVQEVPLTEIDAWLRARVAEGCLIDPKVYTCLYFIANAGRMA